MKKSKNKIWARKMAQILFMRKYVRFFIDYFSKKKYSRNRTKQIRF